MLNNSKNDGLSLLNKKKYWVATIKLTISLLFIWFSVSYGAGILFREKLDEYYFGGAPLGFWFCLLYTSPSPRDRTRSRMPSSA